MVLEVVVPSAVADAREEAGHAAVVVRRGRYAAALIARGRVEAGHAVVAGRRVARTEKYNI